MMSHGEMEALLPFRIKIIKQYKDCLSRQMGEAIKILLSKDQLLHSKNEYIQNCIARKTVQEDPYERKARLLQEEDEERKLEQAIMDFKTKKRNSKRKPEEESFPAFQKLFKRQKLAEDMTDPPERELGRRFQEAGITGKERIAFTEAGKDRLIALRLRMAEESRRVKEFLDHQKVKESDQILESVRDLWVEMESKVPRKRKPEVVIPEG